MLPGPEQVLQCPACGTVMLQPTISSGNTLDAVYYTDGYMDAPMLPQPAVLVRCPGCLAPFQRHRAQVLGEVDRYGTNLFPDERPATRRDPAWRRAPRVQPAERADYLADLATHRYAREDEIELRLELMHLCNHPRRRLPPRAKRPPVTSLEQANLRKLAALLDLRDDEERVMLAEVRRELGDFEMAGAMLARDVPEELALAARRIRQLVGARDRWVAEVSAREG